MASDYKTQLAQCLTLCVQDADVTGWRYTLIGDIAHHVPDALTAGLSAIVHEWFEFRNGVDGWAIAIHAPYSTDGATMAPDFVPWATLSRCQHVLGSQGPVAALRLCGPFIAHWCHDIIYQFAVEIAGALGWSVWRTIRFAN